MPLLNILGADGLDQGFTVGAAFLDHETEEDFDWAVDQLKACFKPESFPSVIATDCEEALIQALESKFPATRTNTVLSYCLGKWLGTYKRKVIHAFVDKFFHGGTTTTSRLEGAHHVLKSWIGPPKKDLTGVWNAVRLAISHQLSEIRAHRAQQMSGTRIMVMGHITPHALRKLHMQWTISRAKKISVEERSALFAQGHTGDQWE
jgi:hypothetical protein